MLGHRDHMLQDLGHREGHEVRRDFHGITGTALECRGRFLRAIVIALAQRGIGTATPRHRERARGPEHSRCISEQRDQRDDREQPAQQHDGSIRAWAGAAVNQRRSHRRTWCDGALPNSLATGTWIRGLGSLRWLSARRGLRCRWRGGGGWRGHRFARRGTTFQRR